MVYGLSLNFNGLRYLAKILWDYHLADAIKNVNIQWGLYWFIK